MTLLAQFFYPRIESAGPLAGGDSFFLLVIVAPALVLSHGLHHPTYPVVPRRGPVVARRRKRSLHAAAYILVRRSVAAADVVVVLLFLVSSSFARGCHLFTYPPLPAGLGAGRRLPPARDPSCVVAAFLGSIKQQRIIISSTRQGNFFLPSTRPPRIHQRIRFVSALANDATCPPTTTIPCGVVAHGSRSAS